MHIEDFYVARDIGYEAALAGRHRLTADDDADSFRDKVHPGAFSDALDEFPQYEAAELSEAVDEGIATAYQEELLSC